MSAGCFQASLSTSVASLAQEITLNATLQLTSLNTALGSGQSPLTCPVVNFGQPSVSDPDITCKDQSSTPMSQLVLPAILVQTDETPSLPFMISSYRRLYIFICLLVQGWRSSLL